MLVAGSVSFVSCSDDDEEETTQTVEVETTTNTVTINGTAYTYTTVDGKVQPSDNVTVSDDGTIKIKADDGSYVTIKGTTITYTNAEGKSSSGTLGTESVTLSGDAGEISATSTSETKTETSETKTETKTTGGSETSLSGNTYVTYDLTESKAQIHSISFSSDSGKLVKLTSKDGKDNEVESGTGSYTVSGSDLLVDGEKLAVINSDGTITSTEGRTSTKYSGDVYAYTSYSSSKTIVEILNLGSDGKGYFIEDKMKNGSASEKEEFDFTYTKSENSITITASAGGETMTATGTISTGTQSGVSVEKLSVLWGEDDVGEYIKLN